MPDYNCIRLYLKAGNHPYTWTGTLYRYVLYALNIDCNYLILLTSEIPSLLTCVHLMSNIIHTFTFLQKNHREMQFLPFSTLYIYIHGTGLSRCMILHYWCKKFFIIHAEYLGSYLTPATFKMLSQCLHVASKLKKLKFHTFILPNKHGWGGPNINLHELKICSTIIFKTKPLLNQFLVYILGDMGRFNMTDPAECSSLI